MIGYNVRTFSMLDLPIKDSAAAKPIIREDIKEDSTLVSLLGHDFATVYGLSVLGHEFTQLAQLCHDLSRAA